MVDHRFGEGNSHALRRCSFHIEMNSDSKTIVVIGSGVIGLSVAYYSARRGHRVTVIDRSPARRDGCSFGNAGMIVPSHFVPLAAPGAVSTALKWMLNPESPFYVRPRLDWDLVSWGWKFMRAANARHVERSAPLIRDLSFASRDCFEELAALPNNDFGLVKKGLVMLCKTQESLDHEAAFARQANQLGVPAEVLNARDVAKLDPDVTMDVAGGVYFPKDCHLSPNRFMEKLQKQCEALGVKFVWNTELGPVRLRKRADGTTNFCCICDKSSSEEFSGDEFVLAGGSWSPLIGRELGLALPMQAGKGYSLTLAQPRELPQLCSILAEARVAVTPMGDTLRFGGTMEMAGLNEDINPVRVRGIIKAAVRYFPKFTAEDFAGIQPWRGLRPCSPDGLPYLGRTRKYSNLLIATGHAMMGLSLGPITGKLVSQMISGERSSLDLALMDPDRYG
jgi:D-amino-acid dehydrogenase